MKNIHNFLENFDHRVVTSARRMLMPFAKLSIFICYFYFGFLKVFDASPASPLVSALLFQTMPFIEPGAFLVAFGIVEMVIGILFIIPRLERLAVFVLFLHLVTTVMPLFILPEFVWSSFLVPTIEGQYIIKNVLLLLAGIVILSQLKSYKESKINNV